MRLLPSNLNLNRFRWAACQVDALGNCLDYRTLQQALVSLPRTLDETYSRILHSIPPEHKKIATLILQLAVFSEHPLEVKEVVDAIAVDTEREPFFSPEYRMPEPQELTRYCSSLVTVVSTSEQRNENNHSLGKVQLAHFSVKEYLTSRRLDSDIAPNFQECTARGAIAQTCLAYILHFNEEFSAEHVIQRYPFAKYSAKYWMKNAAKIKDRDTRVLELIEKLFCHRKISYNICFRFHPSTWSHTFSESPDMELPSALYYAAVGGLIHTIKQFADRGVNVNVQGGKYGNPLQAASFKGYEEIVKHLLNNGANVNAEGGRYGNALQAASFNGHKAIIKLLLDNGANINAQGGTHGSALQAASVKDHKAIVKLLLTNGADVTVADDVRNTSVHEASSNGYLEVLRLLIEEGADVTVANTFKETPVFKASRNGYLEVVMLLIKAGADITVANSFGETPVSKALDNGHLEVFKLLIENGADINVIRHGGWTQLHSASGNGNLGLVKLLIESGANINIAGHRGLTPLHLASGKGKLEVVKLLIKKGADVNIAENGGLTPLQLALENGNLEVVNLLIEK